MQERNDRRRISCRTLSFRQDILAIVQVTKGRNLVALTLIKNQQGKARLLDVNLVLGVE